MGMPVYEVYGSSECAGGLSRCLVSNALCPTFTSHLYFFLTTSHLCAIVLYLGPHSYNLKGFWRIGTAGRLIPGTESKADPYSLELCQKGFRT